jgi:hypothetical protein
MEREIEELRSRIVGVAKALTIFKRVGCLKDADFLTLAGLIDELERLQDSRPAIAPECLGTLRVEKVVPA